METWFDGELHQDIVIAPLNQKITGFKLDSRYAADLVGPWEEPDQVAIVEEIPLRLYERDENYQIVNGWAHFNLTLKEIARHIGGTLKAVQLNIYDPSTKKGLILGSKFELQYKPDAEGAFMGRL